MSLKNVVSCLIMYIPNGSEPLLHFFLASANYSGPDISYIHQQRQAQLSGRVAMSRANESRRSLSSTCHLSPIMGHESSQTFEGSQHHKMTPSWKDTR